MHKKNLHWWRIGGMALLFALAASALFVLARQNQPGLPPEPPEPKIPTKPQASLSQLPLDLQLALRELCGNCTFANSNEPWTSTDVVMDSSLPTRRIIDVRKTDDHWAVKYERGGMFSSEHTVVFSNDTPPEIAAGSSCVPTQTQVCKW